MTVKELKQKLESVDDSVRVIVPLNAGEGFDGMFFSPCIEESGEAELGLEDLDEEEIAERKLLNKPIHKEKSFALVPCGFFQESHDEVSPELN
jgi:hypothetical protein